MPLNSESRKFLSDIFGKKPNKLVPMRREFDTNEPVGVLNQLKKNGAITALDIDELDKNNPFVNPTSKDKIYLDIRFRVTDWKKIDAYGEEEFNKLTVEPYGKDKQVRIAKERIISKALKLENNEFRFRDWDLGAIDGDHIVFMEILETLRKKNFLEYWDCTFDIYLGTCECFIKVLKDTKELQEKNKPKIINEKIAKTQKKKPVPAPKFHFTEGILFRDYSDNVIKIKNENSQEYRLLATAFKLPLKTRIDAATDEIELTARQIYDTATRLNQKIKEKFGPDQFFDNDYNNKYVRRVVE